MGLKGINRREFIGRTTLGIFSTGFGLPLLKINPVQPRKAIRDCLPDSGQNQAEDSYCEFWGYELR